MRRWSPNCQRSTPRRPWSVAPWPFGRTDTHHPRCDALLGGVAFATAEPLALALAALGLSLALERRMIAGGLAFAGAALTKETYLVFAVATAAWLALGAGQRRRAQREVAVLVAPGLLLLGLWWAYVAWRIPASAGDHEALGAIGPPLAGWVHAIRLVLGAGYVPDAPVGPLGALLLVGP